MIYVLLTYFFYPFLYLIASLKKKSEVKRILVIQTAKIGDMICSAPVIREIKKKYPHVHLSVMQSHVTGELTENNPYLDEIITIKNTDYKGLLGKIRLSNLICRGKYDIAICLNPNVPFAIALFWGLVPIRLSVMPDFSGFTFKLASVFFTYLEKHISGRLVMETYMQMLKAIGIESSNISKEVYKSEGADIKVQQILRKISPSPDPSHQGRGSEDGLPSMEGEIPSPLVGEPACPVGRGKGEGAFSAKINKPLIGIAVSSGNKLKEPGVEKIAGITNMLLDSFDAQVVFIGSKEDKETANKVLVLVNKKNRIIDATGKFSLGELPALVEKLSLFIGVDTGITYMADALLIPIIDIAGPSDMDDQRPLGKNTRIIQKDISCVPCSHAFKSPYSCKRGDKICITSVDVSEIIEAAKKLL